MSGLRRWWEWPQARGACRRSIAMPVSWKLSTLAEPVCNACETYSDRVWIASSSSSPRTSAYRHRTCPVEQLCILANWHRRPPWPPRILTTSSGPELDVTREAPLSDVEVLQKPYLWTTLTHPHCHCLDEMTSAKWRDPSWNGIDGLSEMREEDIVEDEVRDIMTSPCQMMMQSQSADSAEATKEKTFRLQSGPACSVASFSFLSGWHTNMWKSWMWKEVFFEGQHWTWPRHIFTFGRGWIRRNPLRNTLTCDAAFL